MLEEKVERMWRRRWEMGTERWNPNF